MTLLSQCAKCQLHFDVEVITACPHWRQPDGVACAQFQPFPLYPKRTAGLSVLTRIVLVLLSIGVFANVIFGLRFMLGADIRQFWDGIVLMALSLLGGYAIVSIWCYSPQGITLAIWYQSLMGLYNLCTLLLHLSNGVAPMVLSYQVTAVYGNIFYILFFTFMKEFRHLFPTSLRRFSSMDITVLSMTLFAIIIAFSASFFMYLFSDLLRPLMLFGS